MRKLVSLLCITVAMIVVSIFTGGDVQAAQKVSLQTKVSNVQASAACTVREIQLTWVGYEYLVLYRAADQTIVHLQRDSKNSTPVVDVYLNRQWSGQYNLPLQIDTAAMVTLKQSLGFETWLGSVRQTWKFLPVARFCQETWQPYWLAQDGQTVTAAGVTSNAGVVAKSLAKMSPLVQHAKASACAYSEVEIPWFGYHYIIFTRANGSSYILQRYVYKGYPTVVTFTNYQKEAQYYLPYSVASDLTVYMKTVTVYNTVHNQIVAYNLSVPVARYCTGSFSVDMRYPQL